MPKKTTKPSPDLLLARLTINPDALQDLQASYLPFNHWDVLETFKQSISRPDDKRNIPLRRLNNLLLACAPTLTHGFEWAKPKHRALTVGTSTLPIQPVDPIRIHELILEWARDWASFYRDEYPTACQKLLDDLQRVQLPSWQAVSPEQLVLDTTAQNNLVYVAIPALIATLLHDTSTSIRDGQEPLTWRKVQGDGSDRTGLYVVSQPFRGDYEEFDSQTKESKGNKTGYFAYRLDFEVETQAGRFYEDGKRLKPWVFMRLSCQRYAHESLTRNNLNRNTSILTRIKQPRYDNLPLDQTLVRLQVGWQRNDAGRGWLERLPELLANAKARPLVTAEEILCNPNNYGVLGHTVDPQKDEHYVVHAEGYKYEGRQNHSIKTGFHFDERREVFDKVITQLNGVLRSDETLPADRPTPTGIKLPNAMRPFDKIRIKVREAYKKQGQVTKAKSPSFLEQVRQWQRIGLGLGVDEKAQLLFVYREQSTLLLIQQQARKALLLSDDDEWPEWLTIKLVEITDSNLMALFEKYNRKVAGGVSRKQHFSRQFTPKRDAWQSLLANAIDKEAKVRLAFIELSKIEKKDESVNIKGAIREACSRLNILSQMIQTIPYPKNTTGKFSEPVKSRALNASLDLLVRQSGILFGSPGEIYKQAGLPTSVAEKMDVIALYRRQTTSLTHDLQYALAVRLKSDGRVDVLLPHLQDWIPYTVAASQLGNFFTDNRGVKSTNQQQVGLQMQPYQFAQFAARVATLPFDTPTLIAVDAEGWRNAPNQQRSVWPQLKNDLLADQRDILDFSHVHGHNRHYERNEENLNQLLGIVRLRLNNETPQYLPANITEQIHYVEPLSGFIDKQNPDLWHYYSIGRQSKTQKEKVGSDGMGLFKMEFSTTKDNGIEYGVNTSFRYQQVVEMVPFFVHPSLQNADHLLAICRATHYLRSSPAWSTGNTLLPFPMHLAKTLVDDYLCFLT